MVMLGVEGSTVVDRVSGMVGAGVSSLNDRELMNPFGHSARENQLVVVHAMFVDRAIDLSSEFEGTWVATSRC